MLDQSLPRSEFEVLFVDDGSTDDTPARLDALAAEHAHFRVIHTPNSGWPGRPRNIGIEEARGDYVQFLDNDDWMAPEALERLYRMAARNHSDIVIGKVASDFRGVPQSLFRRSRAACTIHDAPLIDSLTPHKLFRRAFLLEHDLRFPEGRRRLEDQLFMVRAYFPARVVSILADYVCYFYARRGDGRNAGSTPIEPESYYANLREVLGVVVANTQPGEFRDRLLRRFFRVEMLGRISEPAYLRYEPDYRDRCFTAVRDLAADVIGDGVDAGLGGLLRLRASLVRNNDRDGLLELARRASELQAIASLESAAWRRGRLALSFAGSLERRDGGDGGVLVRTDDGHVSLGPGLTQGLAAAPVDVTDEARSCRADLILRERSTATEWVPRSRATVELAPVSDGADAQRVKPVVHGVAEIDTLDVAGGGALAPGTWELWVRVSGIGLDRRARLGPVAASEAAGSLSGGPRGVTALVAEDGGLILEVERAAGSTADRKPGGVIAARVLTALVRTAGPAAERGARLVYRPLPAPLKRVARAAYRRVRPSLRSVVRSSLVH